MNLKIIKSSNFGSIQCDFYQKDDEIFMTREQIGRALDYSDPIRAISKIHSRNPERLNRYSVVTKLTTTDGKRYKTTKIGRASCRERVKSSVGVIEFR